MKKLALIIILLFITTGVYADTLLIPNSCYPRQLQETFAENGLKLDLSANDRTKESWGFIESRGTTYNLHTYKSVTEEELNLIQEIVWLSQNQP